MSTASWSRPTADVSVTSSMIHDLLARDHPDLAGLELGDAYEGWDNVTVRLGADLAVRVPRRTHAAQLIEREHVWLPRLAEGWTFAAPVPARLGGPSEELPWAWAVVPWLPGVPAYTAPLSRAGARALGRALAELHAPAPPEAPRNPFRSTPLAERAERFDDRIERLLATGLTLDDELARQQFHLGAAQRRPLEVWCHLDLHGANVLSADGALGGILDWGDLGVADPATDLGQAWCLVGSSRMRDLLDGYDDAITPLDEGAMLRVRAEALAYAVTLAALTEEPYAEAGRRALVDLEVLAA
ncbi:phosphotransferase [Demequina mangrovi]|uniref:Predicted kinase, aminoglycoside phosphotransferase (APT) family n=1 Tax=Demequina mangrovi TaxID=1043493 RepID=A0A1H7AM26_9MICO|nr:phosphotransferase [Demequina mangrovi]SEJ66428.1 Predicted kinase, aminoglycoside phosphotransferase (APT) family [Demequina mangrovi]